jgi:hypothetical protein
VAGIAMPACAVGVELDPALLAQHRDAGPDASGSGGSASGSAGRFGAGGMSGASSTSSGSGGGASGGAGGGAGGDTAQDSGHDVATGGASGFDGTAFDGPVLMESGCVGDHCVPGDAGSDGGSSTNDGGDAGLRCGGTPCAPCIPVIQVACCKANDTCGCMYIVGGGGCN